MKCENKAKRCFYQSFKMSCKQEFDDYMINKHTDSQISKCLGAI